MQNDQELLDPKEIGTAKRTKTPAKKKEANTSMKKPIVATVVITLAVVAAFAATFAAGMNYANDLHNQRETAVKAAQTALKAQTPQQ